MYEDSWYNYIPELQQSQPTQQHKRGSSQSYGHKRRESLLQQPNVSSNSRAYVGVPVSKFRTDGLLGYPTDQ